MKHKKLPLLILLILSLFVVASCGNKKSNNDSSTNNVGDTPKEVDVPEVATTFTVLHYTENLNDNDYTIDSSEEIPGTSNHYTEVVAKTITGFNAKPFEQKKIMPDGETVIKIYYERVRHTVSINAGNFGTYTGNGKYKYGQSVTVTLTANTGYTFEAWYKENDFISNESTYSFTMGDEDITLSARFLVKSYNYVVNHYKENLDGTYTHMSGDTQIFSGEAFTQTTAQARSYTGFTARQFSQKEIDPNGNTVVDIYYDRVKHTVSLSNSTPSMGSATGAGIFKYGELVTLSASPMTGCEVEGWYVCDTSMDTSNTYSFTMGVSDVSVNVKFQHKILNYTVKHYQEDLNGGYTLVTGDTETLTGEAYTETEAQAKLYTGFSAKPFEEKPIFPDEETVIEIFYDRNEHTVSISNLTPTMGSVTGAGSFKYGETVTLTATPGSNYKVDGWFINGSSVSTDTTYTFTMGDEDVSVEVEFGYQFVNYTVEHYQENLNNDDYTIVSSETETKSGAPYEMTTATAKSFTGFSAQTIEQQEINPNGETVVKIYYKRIRCKINATVNVNGRGTTTGTGTYKYGQKVTLTASANDGYKFDGWADSVNGSTNNYSYSRQVTAEYNSKTYYAIFSPQSYNITINNSGISTSNIKLSGTTAGTNKGYYGYQYTVTVTYDGTDFVTIGVGDDVQFAKTYTFTMPAEAITIDVSVSPMVRQGNVVYFGRYPQTLIPDTDSSLKTTLNSKAGSTPTTSSFNGWLAYSYYSSNSTTPYFMFYKDISYNGETYRGVYFNQYRPTTVSAAASTSTSTSFQDDNNYLINTIYWFKYEPIKWQILTEEDGKALIVSDLVLDAKEFYHESQTNQFYHKNEFGYETGRGYANSYELSDIRRWLNAQFAETAIPLSQRGVWSISEVDNSLESTGVTSNTYAYDCGTTQDVFFLLSYKELKDYFPVEDDRKASASDYAYCQGISSGSYYWLRSPSNYGGNMTFAQYLNYSSYNSQTVTVTTNGVRPACWINL